MVGKTSGNCFIMSQPSSLTAISQEYDSSVFSEVVAFSEGLIDALAEYTSGWFFVVFCGRLDALIDRVDLSGSLMVTFWFATSILACSCLRIGSTKMTSQSWSTAMQNEVSCSCPAMFSLVLT